MKALSWALFAAYLLILLWLVLFKFSYAPLEVLFDYQSRNFNLVPFTRAYKAEMISNFVAFFPFGVMLGVNLKRVGFWRKVSMIFVFSLAVEVTQYVLAIGVTDITDLITNTLGGLAGLTIYVVLSNGKNVPSLDRVILVIGTLILLAILYLRLFVFIVRY